MESRSPRRGPSGTVTAPSDASGNRHKCGWVTFKPAELHPRSSELSLEQALGLAPPPEPAGGAQPPEGRRPAEVCPLCEVDLDPIDVGLGICGACEYGLEP